MKRTLLVLTATSLAGLAAPAYADGEFSLGASAGYLTISDEIGGLDFEGEDIGYKAFARWMMNENLGIEGGYIDFGEPDENILGQNFAFDANGWTAYLVGSIPLGESFDIFGKAGAVFWDADAIVDGVNVGNEDGTDLALGGGLRLNVSESLSFRTELDWYDVDDVDQAWMASVGFELRF